MQQVCAGPSSGPTPTLFILPVALMQFMGDQSKPRGKDEMDLLYELLKVSKDGVCCKLVQEAWSAFSSSPAWARVP